MVHAEEIVTVVQRGTANTRWRDFGYIWTLSRQHPLTEVLDGYADIGQAR